MEQPDIHDYLERYFRTSGCEILENNGRTLHIQLSVEMDKLLMNRPFYWKYVENAGLEGQPMQLKLVTDPGEAEASDGEFMHFGSPRLHQIFHSARQLAAYTRLYEDVGDLQSPSVPLEPWLGLNVKISYQCDRKKDLLVSYGLQLINGRVVERFHKHLTSLSLTTTIPDYCFTISPLIKPQSGLNRIQAMIEEKLQKEDHTWAKEARQRWAEDLALLDQFYENTEDKPESYNLEKEALQAQYEPKILVQVVNGGLFYLTKQALTSV
ncbi:MAG TPA: YqhG family protein [Bacillales bacterium]|nr:YqhG family protein [Bacillales bacterium]